MYERFCLKNISENGLLPLFQMHSSSLKLGRILSTVLNATILLLVVVITHLIFTDIVFLDGGYSDWSAFTTCTQTCGGGIQSRSRTCQFPVPGFLGDSCEKLGSDQEERTCNERPCKIDGNFEEWSLWSACNVTCGSGYGTRVRYCINPAPQYGGRDCTHLGPYEEERACKMRPCGVNGGYGEWSTWTTCSQTCGEGRHQRTRKCDAPVPYGTGKSCTEQKLGNAVDDKPCTIRPCDVDGGYSEWSQWTQCSQSCGGGNTERRRVCNSPQASGKGKTCRQQGLGASREIDDCNEQPC